MRQSLSWGQSQIERLFTRSALVSAESGAGASLGYRRQSQPLAGYGPLSRTPRTEGYLVASVLHQIRTLLRTEDGPTPVEYVIQPAVILVVFRTAASWPGSNASNRYVRRQQG